MDRDTGVTRWFDFSAEAVGGEVLVGQDGSFYVTHRPSLRKEAVDYMSYFTPLPGLIGGLSYFRSSNDGDLIKDAVCCAARRIENALASGLGGWLSSAPKVSFCCIVLVVNVCERWG